ncbi:MAG: gamma-glutamyltransferase [SAR202 cluster bacterium]|nr:gamma-glutamyltransferase [SAR202 cluster bacterium]
MKFTSRRSNVRGRNGVVATTQPLAAMAGLRTLLNGGNAIDAAVATAATLNVVEPMSTGIGGDLFALVKIGGDPKIKALNASGRAGNATSLQELRDQNLSEIPSDSPYAITVPGTVSGWQSLTNSYGNMDLQECLKPAIEYAELGYPVSEIIAMQWNANAARLSKDGLRSDLLIDGRPPNAGEIVTMPQLGRTLRAIAEGGADEFYKGSLSSKIASHVQSLGGWLTKDDFVNHKADWVEPIKTDYRGITCWECPPNGQGLNTLIALNILSGFDVSKMGFQSAETYHHLIEAMRLAFIDGEKYIADPSKVDVPIKDLLGKKHADYKRSFINPDNVADIECSIDSKIINDTVYISVVDKDGNACSLINSLFEAFGTGIVVPETSIALHNRGKGFSLSDNHPNLIEANKRPFHTIIPAMATVNDQLWLTYGVMGGMQQAQGHLQMLVNMIDFKLSPQKALDAPRFRTSIINESFIESIADKHILSSLKSKGHNMTLAEPHPSFFGSGQIIETDLSNGTLTGASEPRADGSAVAW